MAVFVASNTPEFQHSDTTLSAKSPFFTLEWAFVTTHVTTLFSFAQILPSMSDPVSPRELRLGNIVFKRSPGALGDELQVDRLTIEPASGTARVHGHAEVFGVPLNDRTLLWLGFVKADDSKFWTLEDSVKIAENFDGSYNVDGYGVSYVHELQNLIFWKEHFELKVDLKKKPLTFG